MRRYLRDFDTSRLPSLETDVLIVGAGIAGLWTALHLPKKTTCTVICKYGYEECNSWLAQGGVAAVFDDDDTFESHIKDTLTAGAGLCNEEVVDILVREAPENMSELISFGVPFDRDDEGNLHMGREGGHSCRRILHSGGDATGRAITFALREKTKSHSNIQICEDTVLTEIFTDEHGVCGALVKDINGYRYVKTANVVMASGGIGHIYRYTTNPRGANGDGIAAAVRAGAKVDRMEMIQFHPTTLITKKKTERQFLISEAVRGEGAILRNGAGEAFMESVHPLKDLAPRDVVTIGILNELKRTGEPHAYLDVSSMTR
ncbi:MAG: FAD-dependent oxidoreductase, partial [Clostridia bacterium]|nr:FAD-dependent oxidoreductase [Clostridia bacterium]